jgi:hypothetical protein
MAAADLPNELWLVIMEDLPVDDIYHFARTSATYYELFPLRKLLEFLAKRELDFVELFPYPSLFLSLYKGEPLTESRSYIEYVRSSMLEQGPNVQRSLMHLLNTGDATKPSRKHFMEMVKSEWIQQSGVGVHILANVQWLAGLNHFNDPDLYKAKKQKYWRIADDLPHIFLSTVLKGNTYTLDFYEYLVRSTENTSYILWMS